MDRGEEQDWKMSKPDLHLHLLLEHENGLQNFI